MPELSISDSDLITLIEETHGPLNLDAAISDDEAEVEDVGHGNEVKAKLDPTKEDSQDLDTTDHEGEDDDRGAETEEPSEGEPEEDAEESEPETAQAEEESGVLASQLGTLKSENEDLKRALEKAAPIVLTPTEDNPLSDMTTEGQVMGYVKQMRNLRDWCFQNLGGGEISTREGKTVDLDARQVGARLSRAEAIINDYAPDRIAYLKELNNARELARKTYPQLFDSRSEWSKIANNYISRHPAMLHDPNYEMVIGDAIAGMEARQAKMKSQKSPTKAAVPVSRALKPHTAPSSKGNATKATRAHDNFMQTGNKRDLEAMILATL